MLFCPNLPDGTTVLLTFCPVIIRSFNTRMNKKTLLLDDEVVSATCMCWD